MKRSDPVTIISCANGFIVEPFYGHNQASPNHRVLVFDCQGELLNFLELHFDEPVSCQAIYNSGNQAERE